MSYAKYVKAINKATTIRNNKRRCAEVGRLNALYFAKMRKGNGQ